MLYNTYRNLKKDRCLKLNKRLYIVLDTETTNNMDFPFVYDLGFSVVDKTGKVYYKRSFVIYDIYVLCKDLMKTAYYANKLPQYEIDLKSKKRELVRFSTARKIILQTMRKYNIYAIMAHNMRFDLNALNTTLRYITTSQQRYFFPQGTRLWCTLAMSRSIFKNKPTYKRYCEENGYLTRNKQIKLTAEIIYRFITGNNDFVENHTGLEDVMIEKEIFSYLKRQHKKMQLTYWKETA